MGDRAMGKDVPLFPVEDSWQSSGRERARFCRSLCSRDPPGMRSSLLGPASPAAPRSALNSKTPSLPRMGPSPPPHSSALPETQGCAGSREREPGEVPSLAAVPDLPVSSLAARSLAGLHDSPGSHVKWSWHGKAV